MTNYSGTIEKLNSLDRHDSKDYSGLRVDTENSLNYLLATMFPRFICPDFPCDERDRTGASYLEKAVYHLGRALSYVLPGDEVSSCADQMVDRLPKIKEILLSDVEAAYEGDPAAKSTDEVILTYPAFTAIGSYRIAHELFSLNVPLIPRIMTEYAHRVTGIDIHPGATIGRRFFIDHGTGVVIGETTTIGEHVKLYQHVTLGARSFEVAEDGSLVKGIKRHPDIGNDVIIYAGATILGGDTVIGNNCVIGGNVWLTHSIPDGETVVASHSREQRSDKNI